MASIAPALVRIKSHLSDHVPQSIVEQACRDSGHVWRERILGPLTTVHLLLLQLLAKVALNRLNLVAKIRVSAAAICQARMRLPLRVMEELVKWTGRTATAANSCWHGLRVVIADGTTFLTPDTPELAAKYGKASNQEATAPGYPVPKLLVLTDLATGLIQKVIGLPHARGEQTVLTRMFRLLRRGDLLLGDRGLVSYAHVALMLRAGIHAVLRLPCNLVVHGRGRGSRRRLSRLGRHDLLVRWARPSARPRSWLSRQRWMRLPDSLELRQIAVCLHRPGFRTQWAWLLTTLLDARKYSAQEIAVLYGHRWQVEVNFRELKRSLGMLQISARTLEGVKKEMLAFVTLYNLVRRIMIEAARRQGVTADRIGFRSAMTWLLWSEPGEDLPRLQVNPPRRRATEPRARKHGGYLFPILKKPRVELRLPPAEVLIPRS